MKLLLVWCDNGTMVIFFSLYMLEITLECVLGEILCTEFALKYSKGKSGRKMDET